MSELLASRASASRPRDLSQPAVVTVLARGLGVFDDGWCEKQVRCKLRAETPVRSCTAEIWLNKRETSAVSQFSVFVGGKIAFQCSVPHGEIVSVTAACPIEASEEFELELSCDFRVTQASDDKRDLSFILRGIEFN